MGPREAYADLATDQPHIPAPAPQLPARPVPASSRTSGWSRPVSATVAPRLLARALVAAALSLLVVHLVRDSHPARPWYGPGDLVRLTARGDLAPPPGR